MYVTAATTVQNYSQKQGYYVTLSSLVRDIMRQAGRSALLLLLSPETEFRSFVIEDRQK
jgi:hypothetical protein